MPHVITREIRGRPYAWNTCGWTDRPESARRYTEAEAKTVLERMERGGEFGVMITRQTRSSESHSGDGKARGQLAAPSLPRPNFV